MADEIGKARESKKALDSEVHSSRTSMDSTARIGSPAPPSKTASGPRVDVVNGQASGKMDYVYLKNVLLQFLEQRDKKHQMQLIPVLGMLLHFDRYALGISFRPGTLQLTNEQEGRTEMDVCHHNQSIKKASRPALERPRRQGAC